MISCLRKGKIIAPSLRPSFRTFSNDFSASMAKHIDAPYTGLLYKQISKQDVKPATESDFFNYTAKRWLFNESYELSQRFVKFNIQGLLDTAVTAAGNGATKCVRAIKLPEGQYNKAFLLIMDSGVEVVAKIPNPNAGPAHHTTASEVATIECLRTLMNIPVPAVLAWSSDVTNPVGAEYIIMEKAKGVLLSDVWYQLEREAKNKIIQQIVDLHGMLNSYPANMHGCLFYRGDVPLGGICSSDALGKFGSKFTIGPLTHPSLWSNGRNELDVYKGPWLNLSSYAADLGLNERQWVLRNAKPRMNYFRDSGEPEQPAEVLDLLDKYLTVVPHITRCPGKLADLERPILSHPDLHLGNIFVDPVSNTLTSIIDWQGAAFTPLVKQAEIPRMVRHPEPLDLGLFMPERPSNYQELDASAQKAADVLHESALCQKYYEVLLAKKHPQLYAALLHNSSFNVPFIEPVSLVCGSWIHREIHKLRSSLINIADDWRSLGTGLSSCPIAFSVEQIHLHDKELENISHIESIMEAFQNEGILPADGRVNPEDFEVLKEVSRSQKEAYLSLAVTADEATAMERTWPWQDWPERAAN